MQKDKNKLNSKNSSSTSLLEVSVKRQQIFFNHKQPGKTVSIRIRSPEQSHCDIKQSLQSQVRFQNLKNPSKYKPKQLTDIKISLISSQSEEMKIAKHFKSVQLDDTKAQNDITFYIHPHHYELLKLSNDFGDYLLGSWNGKVEIELQPPNILLFKGEFKLETISELKQQIQSHLNKICVIRWDGKKVKSQHFTILERMEKLGKFKFYFNEQKSEYVYFYCKDEEQTNNILKAVTNLQERMIDLATIFRQNIKLQGFKLSYLQRMDIQKLNIIVKINKSKLTVFGLIPDILSYQKLLHVKFSSMVVKDIQFQKTRVNQYLLNKYIRMLKQFKQYSNVIPVKQNKPSKPLSISKVDEVYLFYKEKKIEEIELLQVYFYSFDLGKLNKVFYEFINDLNSITFKIINVKGSLKKKHINKIKLQYSLDVVEQPGTIIVQGLPRDIQRFQKNFDFQQIAQQQQKQNQIKKKKRALRNLEKNQSQIQYNLFMKKAVAELFEKTFNGEIIVSTKLIKELAILNVRVINCQDLIDLQKRIYDFCASKCSPAKKVDFHSRQNKLIQRIQIDRESVSVLKNYGWNHKLVLQIKKVHNTPYQLIYRSCLHPMSEEYLWMPVNLPIESVEKMLLEDVRELSHWEKGNFVFKFNTLKTKIRKDISNCILLATTFIRVGQQETITLEKYQFLIRYVLKLNNMAVKMMLSKQPS